MKLESGISMISIEMQKNPDLYLMSTYNSEKENKIAYLKDITKNEVVFNVKNVFEERMFYDFLALRSPIYNILSFYSDPLNQNQNIIKERWLSNTRNVYTNTTKIFQYKNYVKKILSFPKLSQKDLQNSLLLPKDYENILVTAGNDLNIRYWNLTTNQHYHINNYDGRKRSYNTISGDINIINETYSRSENEIRGQPNGAKTANDKCFSDFQFKNGYSLNTGSSNIEKSYLASASHKDVINDMILMDRNEILVTCSRDHTIKLWK